MNKTTRYLPRIVALSLGLMLAGVGQSAKAADATWNNVAPTSLSLTYSGSAGYYSSATPLAVGDIFYSGASADGFTNNKAYYVVNTAVINGTTCYGIATSAGGAVANLSGTTGATITTPRGAYVWDATAATDTQTASTWTGGAVPSGVDAIATISSNSNAGPNMLVIKNPVTIGTFNYSTTNSDLALFSTSVTGSTGDTTLSALTFATSAGIPTFNVTGGKLVRFGLGDATWGQGTLKVSGSQGLVFNVPSGTVRIESVDWSGFSDGAGGKGTIYVQQGGVSSMVGNGFGTGVNALNLTVGTASTTSPAEFNMGNSQNQTFNVLNGNSYGRISGNQTLTIGDGNGTGGDFAGIIGQTGGGSNNNTGLTKNGTGTQTISGNIVSATGVVSMKGGVLILNGSNSYGGGTSLASGTLKLGNSNALGSGTLTFGVGTSVLDINGNSVGNALVNSTGGAVATITNSAATSGTISAGFNLSGTTGVVINDMTITGNAGGDIVWTGAFNRNSGSGTLTKSGNNTLSLTGTAVFNGMNINLNGGTIVYSHTNSAAVPVLTITSGTFKMDPNNQVSTANGWSGFIANNVVMNGGVWDLNDSGTNGVNNRSKHIDGTGGVITNNGTALAQLSFGLRDTGTSTWSGNIVDGSNGGIVSVQVSDSGSGGPWNYVQILSGTNTYSGTTLINSLSGISAVRAGSTTALSPNSAFTVNGALDLNGFSNTIGSLAGNGSVKLGAGALTTNGNNSNTSFTGVISGVGGSVIKTGTGLLALTASNSFDSGLSINNGTVGAGKTAGTSYNLGGGDVTVNSGGVLRLGYQVATASNVTTTPNNVVLAGGSVFVDDAFQHISGGVSVNAASTVGSTYNSGNNLSTESDKGLFLDGIVSGSAALSVQQSRFATGGSYCTSMVHFTNGANTYSGTITVNENTTAAEGGVYLGLDSSNALQFANVNISPIPGTNQKFGASPIVFKTGIGSASVGSISGNGNLVLTGYDEVNHAYGTDAIALTVGSNNANAVISGSISGVGSLSKAGLGKLTLSAVNSYSGATTVNGGTLEVTGAIATSAVTVNAASILTGSGTTGDVTVAGGTLQANTANFTTGALSLTGSGTFALSINTDLGTSSKVTASSLSLDSNNTAVLTITDTGLDTAVAAGTKFAFLDFTGSVLNQFTYTGVVNGNTGTFVLNEGDVITLGSNAYSFSYAGTDNSSSALTLVAVPEPSTWAMLVGGFGLLIRFQRSRRRSA